MPSVFFSVVWMSDAVSRPFAAAAIVAAVAPTADFDVDIAVAPVDDGDNDDPAGIVPAAIAADRARVAAMLAEHDVHVMAMGPQRLRFVTHSGVGPEHVDRLVGAAEGLAASV